MKQGATVKYTSIDLNLHMYNLKVINVCTQLIKYKREKEKRKRPTLSIMLCGK